jgi:hypothetical protein
MSRVPQAINLERLSGRLVSDCTLGFLVAQLGYFDDILVFVKRDQSIM